MEKSKKARISAIATILVIAIIVLVFFLTSGKKLLKTSS